MESLKVVRQRMGLRRRKRPGGDTVRGRENGGSFDKRKARRRAVGAEEGNGEMKSLKVGGRRKRDCDVVSAGAAIRCAEKKMVGFSASENRERAW